jgi:hypothetical protein
LTTKCPDTAKAVNPVLGYIQIQRFNILEELPLSNETADSNVEERAIQALRDIGKLPFRPADSE